MPDPSFTFGCCGNCNGRLLVQHFDLNLTQRWNVHNSLTISCHIQGPTKPWVQICASQLWSSSVGQVELSGYSAFLVSKQLGKNNWFVDRRCVNVVSCNSKRRPSICMLGEYKRYCLYFRQQIFFVNISCKKLFND